MDLGIKGKKAIVCASSKGLGKACAKSLVMEGVDVIINSRNQGNLEKTLSELNEIKVGRVQMVIADLNTEKGRKTLGASCHNTDILVTNNDGPPPRNFLEAQKKRLVRSN